MINYQGTFVKTKKPALFRHSVRSWSLPTGTSLLTKLYRLYSDHQFFHYRPSVPGSKPGSHITLDHHISLVSFGLWQFLSLFWFSCAWHFLTVLRCVVRYVVEHPSKMGLSEVFSWLDWGYGFGNTPVVHKVTTTKVKCPSGHVISGATWHH